MALISNTVKENSTIRIRWFDGLRGIASLMIFLHHFILAFIPALYYGYRVESRIFSSEAVLAESPFLFFINGHFLVNLFLLLSGVVLSLQVSRIETLKELLIRLWIRYLRLAIPVFVISLIVYLIANFGLLYHNQAAELSNSPWLHLYYNTPLTFSSVFETSLFSVWVIGNDLYSTAFWMLEHLFYGSLLVYFVGYFFKNYRDKLRLYIITLIIFITIYFDSYLINFGFGMLIAWIIAHPLRKTWSEKYAWTIIILGCLLAGYPQGVQATNLYSLLTPLHDYFGSSKLIHSIGSLLLVLGLLNLKSEPKIFNTKIAQHLGRLYFPIYLIHIPLIFSISSYLFINLIHSGLSYPLSVLFTFLFSLLVLLFLVRLFRRFVIIPVSRFTNKSIIEHKEKRLLD